MAARKRGKKAAKKAAAKKTDTDDVFEKMLSGSKVRRQLARLEVDTDEFAKLYAADNTRGARGIQPPEDYELEAVEEFEKSGDVEALMKALETNRQTAFATVGRVKGYLAKQ